MNTARKLLATLLLLLATPATAWSQNGIVSAGLAEEFVEVKVNYSGATVTLFATPPDQTSTTAGLAVALIGPTKPHVVTRNTPNGKQKFDFISAPIVFAIGAEPQVADTTEPQSLIDAGLNAAASAIPAPEHLTSPDLALWRAALVDLKMQQNLYSLDETTIEHLDGGLRRARMTLPPNAPPGDYTVRAVVFDNGLPVGSSEQSLTLVRTGLEATLYKMSTNQGILYGLLAVLIAFLVGGSAAWLGRR